MAINIRLNKGDTRRMRRSLLALADRQGKDLSNQIFNGVRAATPVDTGNARSGWRRYRRGNTWYIVNDVTYIGALDRGHSAQAPHGIVDPVLRRIFRN